jgi:cobalamin synthase
MSAPLSLETSRRRLAVLWFAGAAVSFVTLLAQTLLGRYGKESEQAWGWLLPSVVPTLSLIIGVLAVSANKPPRADLVVDRFFYRLSWWLSAVYLATVAATLFVQPLTRWAPLDLMLRSNLWLGPMQGLVAAALAAFFFRPPD